MASECEEDGGRTVDGGRKEGRVWVLGESVKEGWASEEIYGREFMEELVGKAR